MLGFSKASLVFLGFSILGFIFFYASKNINDDQQLKPANFSYSQFLTIVQNGNINSIVLNRDVLEGRLVSSGEKFIVAVPEGENVTQRVSQYGVHVKFANVQDKDWDSHLSVLLSMFPPLLFVFLWMFFMRQMKKKD
ncbi:MAG: ATP-dependent metallopeptidase FtsH/Yme1/Tma family protein [Bdellovibrionales bacterium]